MKVAIIGSSDDIRVIEAVKKLEAECQDVEIVIVSSLEDLPNYFKYNSNPSSILTIKNIPEMKQIHYVNPEINSSHRRPYKFHK